MPAPTILTMAVKKRVMKGPTDQPLSLRSV